MIIGWEDDRVFNRLLFAGERCYVSVNGKRSKQLIDPKVDLASEEWKHFKHHDWILPSK